ncbi:MAG: type II toxin-antitoxin system VapC family toxin [Acidobacteriia bacterium]|nr:type II toxin-antitoxin system VapC family toxin [Terriglobia bacterium]
MALYYFETSALVKLYIREPGTATMLQLVSQRAGNQFAVLSLAQVEVQSAVRRRQRAGDVHASAADRLLDVFQHHLQTKFVRQHATEVVIESACALVDQYGLTTLDAIHLAAYMSLAMNSGPEPTPFVSADQQLLRAAEALGATIVDVSAGA